MRALSSIVACTALLIAISMPAAAQSEAPDGLRAVSSRGTLKIRVRYFDPFINTRNNRARVRQFRASPFDFPAESQFPSPFDAFSVNESTTQDSLSPSDDALPTVSAPVAAVQVDESSNPEVISSSLISSSSSSEPIVASPSPVVVAPLSGGIAASSSSGRPWYRPPVRSPYRPPPRLPFGP